MVPMPFGPVRVVFRSPSNASDQSQQNDFDLSFPSKKQTQRLAQNVTNPLLFFQNLILAFSFCLSITPNLCGVMHHPDDSNENANMYG